MKIRFPFQKFQHSLREENYFCTFSGKGVCFKPNETFISHYIKARKEGKFYVFPSKSERLKNSTVPYLQNILNKKTPRKHT